MMGEYEVVWKFCTCCPGKAGSTPNTCAGLVMIGAWDGIEAAGAPIWGMLGKLPITCAGDKTMGTCCSEGAREAGRRTAEADDENEGDEKEAAPESWLAPWARLLDAAVTGAATAAARGGETDF
jgi:hypothetical protein